MCFLNEKCHPLFEFLHRTALARSKANLSFEVYLLSFPLNTDETLPVLTLWPFWSFWGLMKTPMLSSAGFVCLRVGYREVFWEESVGLHDVSFRYSGHCCFEYMYIWHSLPSRVNCSFQG